MKITKGYLKRIIKEEMRRVLREQEEGSDQIVYLVMGEDHVSAGDIELMGVHRTKEAAHDDAERRDSEQEDKQGAFYEEGLEYDFQVRSISPQDLLKHFNEGTTLQELIETESPEGFDDLFKEPEDPVEEDSAVFGLHKASKRVATEDYATFSAKHDAKMARRDKKRADAEEEYYRQNERKARKTRGKMISAKRRR